MPWFRQDSNFRGSGCRGVGFRAVEGLGVEGLRVKPTPSDSHLDSCTLPFMVCSVGPVLVDHSCSALKI